MAAQPRRVHRPRILGAQAPSFRLRLQAEQLTTESYRPRAPPALSAFARVALSEGASQGDRCEPGGDDGRDGNLRRPSTAEHDESRAPGDESGPGNPHDGGRGEQRARAIVRTHTGRVAVASSDIAIGVARALRFEAGEKVW